MRIKPLHIVSALSFIAIAQLLFFWLVSPAAKAFVAVYPFYTVLTVAHTALLAFICTKYKYPACFAPALCGSIVTAGEIVAGLLLGLFCQSVRTMLFVQAIIVVVYVLVMAFFCGVTSILPFISAEPDTPSYATCAAGNKPAPNGSMNCWFTISRDKRPLRLSKHGTTPQPGHSWNGCVASSRTIRTSTICISWD